MKIIELTHKQGYPLYVNVESILVFMPSGVALGTEICLGDNALTYQVKESVSQILELLAEEEKVTVATIESAYSGDPDTKGEKCIKPLDKNLINSLPIGTKLYLKGE